MGRKRKRRSPAQLEGLRKARLAKRTKRDLKRKTIPKAEKRRKARAKRLNKKMSNKYRVAKKEKRIKSIRGIIITRCKKGVSSRMITVSEALLENEFQDLPSKENVPFAKIIALLKKGAIKLGLTFTECVIESVIVEQVTYEDLTASRALKKQPKKSERQRLEASIK